MPTTKAHFEAIGRVAREWARLEVHAQLLISRMVKLPHKTSMIMTNPGKLSDWLVMIRRLAVEQKRADRGWLERHKALKNQVDALRQRRNDVVHGLWSISKGELAADLQLSGLPDKARLTTVRRGGAQMLQEVTMTPQEVNAIADEIKLALRTLLELGRDIEEASS